MSFSQGDATDYSLTLRASSSSHVPSSSITTRRKASMSLYESEKNTILEDYEVDVAILLSQLTHHKIDFEDAVISSDSNTSKEENSSQELSYSDLTDEEYRAIFHCSPPPSSSSERREKDSLPRAYKSSISPLVNTLYLFVLIFLLGRRMRSYSERDVFEKEDNEVVFSCPGLGIYSPEERKQVDSSSFFLFSLYCCYQMFLFYFTLNIFCVQRIQRFIDKRPMRVWTKKIKYDVRKNFADSRVRIKGRFVKKEEEGGLFFQSVIVLQ